MSSDSSKNIIVGGIDIGSFLDAFSQFREALKVAQSDLEKTGTIKHFEMTYELAWKTLKRVLAHLGKTAHSPRVVFREAALEGLIDDPEIGFAFIEDRNETNLHVQQKSGRRYFCRPAGI